MTGRDLIVYILQNGLEDEPVFKDGTFIGFVTPADVAMAAHVGSATVHAWIQQERLKSYAVKEGIYIPANYVSPKRVNSYGTIEYEAKWLNAVSGS